jgi:hypothetical protein
MKPNGIEATTIKKLFSVLFFTDLWCEISEKSILLDNKIFFFVSPTMLEYSVSDLNLPLGNSLLLHKINLNSLSEHSAYSTSSFVSNSVVVAFGETKEQGQTIYKDKIQVVKTNGECNTLHAGDQEARSRHASVEMDGKLLLLGGKNQHQYHSSLLLLDIQKDELVNRIASHEAFKRTGFSATAIDQKIFLFGGTGCSANPTDVTMYDVTADRCINMTTKGEFPELSDGKVLA